MPSACYFSRQLLCTLRGLGKLFCATVFLRKGVSGTELLVGPALLTSQRYRQAPNPKNAIGREEYSGSIRGMRARMTSSRGLCQWQYSLNPDLPPEYLSQYSFLPACTTQLFLRFTQCALVNPATIFQRTRAGNAGGPGWVAGTSASSMHPHRRSSYTFDHNTCRCDPHGIKWAAATSLSDLANVIAAPLAKAFGVPFERLGWRHRD